MPLLSPAGDPTCDPKPTADADRQPRTESTLDRMKVLVRFKPFLFIMSLFART